MVRVNFDQFAPVMHNVSHETFVAGEYMLWPNPWREMLLLDWQLVANVQGSAGNIVPLLRRV